MDYILLSKNEEATKIIFFSPFLQLTKKKKNIEKWRPAGSALTTEN